MNVRQSSQSGGARGRRERRYQMKQQSTTKGFAVLSVSNIIIKVLSLVYVPFQTMIIGNYGNGLVSSGYRIYVFLFSLSNAGLPVAISKLIAESNALGDYRGSRRIFRVSTVILLALGVCFSGFVIFGNRLICGYINHQDADLMILAFAPAFLFTSVNCALRGYFQGRRNMVPTALSQVFEQILNSVLTVVFAGLLIRYGIRYAAMGTTFGTTAGAMGAAFFLLYVYRQNRAQRLHELRHCTYTGPERTTRQIILIIMHYTLPAILNSLSTSAVDLIDVHLCETRLVAGGYPKEVAASLFGVYSYQYQRMASLALAVSSALIAAIIPAISSTWALEDYKGTVKKIRDSFKAIFFVTIPSIAGLTFLAQPILTFIFMRNSQGADLIIFGMWSSVLMAILYVQTGVLIAVGKPYIAPVNIILGMLLKIVANYLLIPIHAINIKGAIIGTALGWLIAVFLNQRAIHKTIPGRMHYFRYMVKPTLVSLVMGAACLLFFNLLHGLLRLLSHGRLVLVTSDIALLLSIAVGVVIYASLMIKIRGINKNDILRMPMGKKLYALLLRVPYLRRDLLAQ